MPDGAENFHGAGFLYGRICHVVLPVLGRGGQPNNILHMCNTSETGGNRTANLGGIQVF